MENQEIMNVENMDVIEGEVVTGGKTGLGTGAAMLIGAGVTLAVTAGIKLVKKGIAAAKAKREAKKNAEDDYEVVDEVAEK